MERSFVQKKVTNPKAGEPPSPHVQYSYLGTFSEDFLMGAGAGLGSEDQAVTVFCSR